MGKKKAEQERRAPWKAYLALGLSMATAAIGGVVYKAWNYNQPQIVLEERKKYALIDRDLELARQYPELRQAFLDRLFEEEPIEHCKGLVYDPYLDLENNEYIKLATEYEFKIPSDRNEVDPEMNIFSIARTPGHPRLFGRKRELNVFVSRTFFDLYKNDAADGKEKPIVGNLEDAKNVLVDHEGFHVIDIYNGIEVGGLLLDYKCGLKCPDNSAGFVQTLLESRATYNELKNATRSRRVSTLHYNSTISQLGNCLIELKYLADMKDRPDISIYAKAQFDELKGIIVPIDHERFKLNLGALKK